jgi:hypothetical protein
MMMTITTAAEALTALTEEATDRMMMMIPIPAIVAAHPAGMEETMMMTIHQTAQIKADMAEADMEHRALAIKTGQDRIMMKARMIRDVVLCLVRAREAMVSDSEKMMTSILRDLATEDQAATKAMSRIMIINAIVNLLTVQTRISWAHQTG